MDDIDWLDQGSFWLGICHKLAKPGISVKFDHYHQNSAGSLFRYELEIINGTVPTPTILTDSCYFLSEYLHE